MALSRPKSKAARQQKATRRHTKPKANGTTRRIQRGKTKAQGNKQPELAGSTNLISASHAEAPSPQIRRSRRIAATTRASRASRSSSGVPARSVAMKSGATKQGASSPRALGSPAADSPVTRPRSAKSIAKSKAPSSHSKMNRVSAWLGVPPSADALEDEQLSDARAENEDSDPMVEHYFRHYKYQLPLQPPFDEREEKWLELMQATLRAERKCLQEYLQETDQIVAQISKLVQLVRGEYSAEQQASEELYTLISDRAGPDFMAYLNSLLDGDDEERQQAQNAAERSPESRTDRARKSPRGSPSPQTKKRKHDDEIDGEGSDGPDADRPRVRRRYGEYLNQLKGELGTSAWALPLPPSALTATEVDDGAPAAPLDPAHFAEAGPSHSRATFPTEGEQRDAGLHDHETEIFGDGKDDSDVGERGDQNETEGTDEDRGSEEGYAATDYGDRGPEHGGTDTDQDDNGTGLEQGGGNTPLPPLPTPPAGNSQTTLDDQEHGNAAEQENNLADSAGLVAEGSDDVADVPNVETGTTDDVAGVQSDGASAVDDVEDTPDANLEELELQYPPSEDEEEAASDAEQADAAAGPANPPAAPLQPVANPAAAPANPLQAAPQAVPLPHLHGPVLAHGAFGGGNSFGPVMGVLQHQHLLPANAMPAVGQPQPLTRQFEYVSSSGGIWWHRAGSTPSDSDSD